MNIYDKHLQIIANRGIINSYLTYGKGGTNDRNGRIHYTRGGSTESAPACRHREAVVTHWRDARLQDRQSMAYQANRIGSVATGAQEQKSRGQVNAGYFLPATPRMLHTSYHAVSSIPMVTLPVCNFKHGEQAVSSRLHAFL